MHILFANDDGIDSVGLRTLVEEAVARGHRATVCAPSRQQSAVSQALTLFSPIQVIPEEGYPGKNAYAVGGTPADCVRLGLGILAQAPVDLVISGINDGLNAGAAVYCSGTVGAAREAALQGLKAMAVSVGRPADDAMRRALAAYALTLGERLIHYPAPPLSVLNVNAPGIPCGEWKPAVMASLNRSLYVDEYERRTSPRGGTYFWVSAKARQDPPEINSDDYFLQNGHITCTFLLHPGEQSRKYQDFLQA